MPPSSFYRILRRILYRIRESCEIRTKRQKESEFSQNSNLIVQCQLFYLSAFFGLLSFYGLVALSFALTTLHHHRVRTQSMIYRFFFAQLNRANESDIYFYKFEYLYKCERESDFNLI